MVLAAKNVKGEKIMKKWEWQDQKKRDFAQGIAGQCKTIAEYGGSTEALESQLIQDLAMELHGLRQGQRAFGQTIDSVEDLRWARVEKITRLSMAIHEANNWLYMPSKDAGEHEKALKQTQKQLGNCYDGKRHTGIGRVQRYLRTIKETAKLDEHCVVQWDQIKAGIDPKTQRRNTAYSVLCKAKADVKPKSDSAKPVKLEIASDELTDWGADIREAFHAFMLKSKKYAECPELSQRMTSLGFDVPTYTAATNSAAIINYYQGIPWGYTIKCLAPYPYLPVQIEQVA